jgi:formylglycine-generating enzyme required for sulfatase activity
MSRTVLALAAIALALSSSTMEGAPARGDRATTNRARVARMIRIPKGTYRPLYARSIDAPRQVGAFWLDRDPVTRGDFLAFVETHPEWRRSRVAAHVADGSAYLADWRSDLDAGDRTSLRLPVTNVSWFAASAYCAARGKRLPTLDEWEYAAAASATERDAVRRPEFIQQLVTTYAARSTGTSTVDAAAVNVYGARGMHDLVWEWVDDFNATSPAHRRHARLGLRDFSCAGAAIGAADASNYPAFLRYAIRAGADARTTLSSMGFRCAA